MTIEETPSSEPLVNEETPALEPAVAEEVPAAEPTAIEAAAAVEPTAAEATHAIEPMEVAEAPAVEPIPTAEAPAIEQALPAEMPTPEPLTSPEMPVLEPITPEEIDPEGLVALKNLEERRRRKKRKRIITIVVVCAIVAAGIAAWFIVNNMNQPKAVEEMKAMTAVVTRENLSATIKATGTVNAGTSVEVTPEVSGVVEEVLVADGQHVNAGDVMFTLKNAELEREVADAAAALEKAQHGLNQANAEVSNAWDSYYQAIDEYNALVDQANAQAATSSETAAELGPFDHSGYLSAIDSANAGVTTAADAVADAQRNYDFAVAEADKRIVRAPASGTVLGLAATPGSAVGGAAGGTSTASGALARIANLDTLTVDIEVNEIDVSDIKPDQRAEVTFTAFSDLKLDGRVTSVASVASSAGEGSTGGGGGGVVTFKVTTVIDKPDERLKPGMSANVTIMTKDVPDALVIPAAALIEDGTTAYVMVVTDEQAQDGDLRQIEVGERAGSQVAVKSGLTEGELVLVNMTGGLDTTMSGAAALR